MRLQGLRAPVTRVSNIAGPPLGGLAMGLGGAPAAFMLAGSFFAVSVPLLTATRIGPLPQGAPCVQGTGGAGRELLDGLRYLRRHRLVGPLVVSGAVCELVAVGTSKGARRRQLILTGTRRSVTTLQRPGRTGIADSRAVDALSTTPFEVMA